MGCAYANDQVVQGDTWHEVVSLFPSAHTSSYCYRTILKAHTQNITMVKSFVWYRVVYGLELLGIGCFKHSLWEIKANILVV